MEIKDKAIKDWLHHMEIWDYDICDCPVHWRIVHVVGTVDISNKYVGQIPFQFGYVSGDFDCASNDLLSLKGCPVEVGRDFYCNDNVLRSLEFSPLEIGRDFYCYGNSFSGIPDRSHIIHIGGTFGWKR